MIVETQTEIIGALETIDSVSTVISGIGDFEELIKKSYRLPALLVIYNGARFQPAGLIGSTRAQHVMSFTVLSVIRNSRSVSDGAADSFSLIEKTREKLIGLVTLSGRLWPVSENLILADAGLYVYGLEYTIKAETTGV